MIWPTQRVESARFFIENSALPHTMLKGSTMNVSLKISALSLSLAVFALLPMMAPAGADAAPIRQITEGTSLVIDRATFEPIELVPGSLLLVRGPDHGVVGPSPTRGLFSYQPDDFYIGFDRLIFSANRVYPRETILLELKIRVLPTTLPVAGTFAEDSYGAFGLYHQAATTFELCDPWLVNTNELKCAIWPVAEASPGWLPVYGDWDGDGFHMPSLFDPTTGTLHHLQQNVDDGELKIVLSVRIPETRWTWPTAGDWNNDGADGLLLVHDSGELFEAFDIAGDPWTLKWPNTIPTPSNDALPFPARWPFTQRAHREAVAVIDFANRVLHWTTSLTEKNASGTITLNRVEGRQIPFGASAAAVLHGTPDLYYLELSILDGTHILEVNHWSFGHPSTLPLKFPHEPPGI